MEWLGGREVIALLIAAQATVPPAAAFALPMQAQVASERESPALAAARANKPLKRTMPQFKSKSQFARPPAVLAEGAFGDVTLAGIIGEDGRLTEAHIAQSGRSEALDAAAIALVPAMLFEPARDSVGTPLSIATRIKVEFLRFDGPAKTYRCDQFVRDYDRWKAHWPSDQHDRLYQTMRGFVAGGQLLHPDRPKFPDLDKSWDDAAVHCRQTPDKAVVDVLTPYGAMLAILQ